ncbi:MAG: AraC family transcriptional regulator [Clostridia bacterium]
MNSPTQSIHMDNFENIEPSHISVYWAGCDSGPLPGGLTNGPLIRDCFVFQYCLSGRGTIFVDDRAFQIESGQTFVFYPGVVVTELADKFDPWRFVWAHITASKMEEYLASIGISKYNPVFSAHELFDVRDNLMKLAALTDERNNFFIETTRAAAGFGLISALLMSGRNNECKPQQADVNTTYAASALHYIHANYFHKIKVSDIADHLGLNRCYLFTLFKKNTGYSPQDYLIRFRIRKACDFFQNPRSTVASVAHSVGYDPTVFSQIFKRTTGITPSEYKAICLNASAEEYSSERGHNIDLRDALREKISHGLLSST